MINPDPDPIIKRTVKWISDVVIACNFCPFAAKEMKKGSVSYTVIHKADDKAVLDAVLKIFTRLDTDPETETSLLILSDCFHDFREYLDLLDKAEQLLSQKKYEGIYQLASFHPEYLFAGTDANDPANYTNRSPYPMLHFLREESVTKAIAGYTGVDDIPDRNIAFTRNKGLAFMQQLLKDC